MAYVSAFEVIAQPLAPGVPNVPFVQQGTFVQLTNLGSDASVSVFYYPATPNFVAQSSDQALTLFANYIDQTGAIVQVDANDFIGNANGFVKIPIPSGATLIFGAQYIFTPPSNLASVEMAGGTPQSTAQARGAIQIFSGSGDALQLFCAVTVRQVFNNYDSSGNLQDVDEAAYSLPIADGPIINLTGDAAPQKMLG